LQQPLNDTCVIFLCQFENVSDPRFTLCRHCSKLHPEFGEDLLGSVNSSSSSSSSSSRPPGGSANALPPTLLRLASKVELLDQVWCVWLSAPTNFAVSWSSLAPLHLLVPPVTTHLCWADRSCCGWQLANTGCCYFAQ
jgi:hypothetical protein